MTFVPHLARAGRLAAVLFVVATVAPAGCDEPAVGLRTVAFDTLQGTVTVRLPEDTRAGDTLSGTVVLEPTGRSDRERAKNRDRLANHLLRFAAEETPARAAQWSRTAPESPGTTPLALLDRKGRPVATREIPLAPAAETSGRDFELPRFGQAGQPVAIRGPFDGRFTTSRVTLGGQEVELLAESPRALVVTSPSDVVGPTRLDVAREGPASRAPSAT